MARLTKSETRHRDNLLRLVTEVVGGLHYLATQSSIVAGSKVIVTDGTDDMAVNTDGSTNVKRTDGIASGLSGDEYERTLDGNGRTSTILLKNSGATQATFTFTRDANGRWTDIVRT